MCAYESISVTNINYAIYKVGDWENDYKINILGTSRELPVTNVTKEHMSKNMEHIRASEFEIGSNTVNGMVALAMQLNPEVGKMSLDEAVELEKKEFELITEELNNIELKENSEFIDLNSEEFLIYKLEYDGHMLVSKPANEFTQKYHIEEIKRLKELSGN